MIASNNLLCLIDTDKFSSFINDIYRGYRRDVAYHNDLHGADVAQHMDIILNSGLKQCANLNEYDNLSILVAALCHDFKHDGFNNGYHINASTSRAIAFNDQSVQENYHISETFKVLFMQENNFISHFSIE